MLLHRPLRPNRALLPLALAALLGPMAWTHQPQRAPHRKLAVLSRQPSRRRIVALHQ